MSGPAKDAARTGSTNPSTPRRAVSHSRRCCSSTFSAARTRVEPRTAVSEVTLLLVAHDGEWTRRRVPGVQWAHDFCNRNQVPSYDAAVVGIPQRMREYNARVRRAQKERDRPTPDQQP